MIILLAASALIISLSLIFIRKQERPIYMNGPEWRVKRKAYKWEKK